MDPIKYVTPFYSEPHRRFHDMDHIQSMLDYVGDSISDELRHAIIFHDVVYDPYAGDNEENSCKVFQEYYEQHLLNSRLDSQRVCQLIMATKNHLLTDGDSDEKLIVEADMSVFEDRYAIYNYEQGIFYEFQKFPIDQYIQGRSEFLDGVIAHHGAQSVIGANAQIIKEYVLSRVYNLGIYPGSFNPFHIGHLDVILQAEKVFDKVIIAQGINHTKPKPRKVITRYRQLVEYTGLVTELFEEEDNIRKSLIRGIRSSFDVNYEETFRSAVLDIKEINFSYFFCKKEHNHISSTLIRGLERFNNDLADKYLPDAI